jgi:hypothetical protein
MSKRSTFLWVTGLLLGWAFDLLFWKRPLGINFALYSILCVLGGCLVLLANQQAPARGTWLVFPLILLFAAITALRAEPMTVFLAICFVLLFLIILANTYLGGRWLSYGFGDYLAGILRLTASVVARPISFNAEVRRERLALGTSAKRGSIWPYVRGVVIALPILAIFAALLASADAAFNSQLEAFLKIFNIENLPEYIFRMVYILVGAYALVGVILHASTQSRDEHLQGGDERLISRFLGFTEAAIVLGSVALLFAAFVVIQFRYFFGGQANINIAGFTYSEYARRGFGELVVVAFFSLLMILGLEAVTRRETALQRGVFSGLSVAIVVLVLVMLVSAYQRLVLYETAYGFSRLRTYTHVALVWMGLLLVAVVVLELLQRQKAFLPAMLVAGLGFAFSLAVVNVDALIVRQNVNRATQGKELDVAYLASLSTDSVPALAQFFESSAASGTLHDSVGAALFCRWEMGGEPSGDWRGFTFSRSQADAAMRRVIPQLKGYRLLDDSWPLKIATPAGETYDCRAAGMD